MVLAIPLMRGKVKPNSWYGFRVSATLDNPDVWYPVNAVAGKWLLVLGAINMAAAILIPLIWPDMTFDAYAIILSIIILGGMVFVFVAGMRYANALTAKMDE